MTLSEEFLKEITGGDGDVTPTIKIMGIDKKLKIYGEVGVRLSSPTVTENGSIFSGLKSRITILAGGKEWTTLRV